MSLSRAVGQHPANSGLSRFRMAFQLADIRTRFDESNRKWFIAGQFILGDREVLQKEMVAFDCCTPFPSSLYHP